MLSHVAQGRVTVYVPLGRSFTMERTNPFVSVLIIYGNVFVGFDALFVGILLSHTSLLRIPRGVAQ